MGLQKCPLGGPGSSLGASPQVFPVSGAGEAAQVPPALPTRGRASAAPSLQPTVGWLEKWGFSLSVINSHQTGGPEAMRS